ATMRCTSRVADEDEPPCGLPPRRAEPSAPRCEHRDRTGDVSADATDVPAGAADGDARTSSPTIHRRRRGGRRQELHDAALELFATRGYEATTVDDIVAHVGVSRRMFFYYFASKEEAVYQDD